MITKSQQDHIRYFLNALCEKNPAMSGFLPQLRGKPYFLIASTGLGKTVVVPVFELNRMIEGLLHVLEKKVWVIQPKVFIAQDLAATMNGFWRDYCLDKGIEYGPIFGCKTRADHDNVDAPVVFVTTGIFSIYARAGKFQKDRDTVIIDEAHVTLETDHAMELAVAQCRSEGVRTVFMSATVDEASIKQAFPDVSVVRAIVPRHPVWMHATRKPMEECIEDVVVKTLVRPAKRSEYVAQQNDRKCAAVAKVLQEKDRAKGMLIVVPSYASKNSTAQRVLRVIKESKACRGVETYVMSGAARRDAAEKRKYASCMQRWITERKRYVVIATSVAEMGVTFPNLDVIVTTDEGFAEDGNGNIRLGPLGNNALIQRAGRVGRERPGLVVITKDAGAEYASYDDRRLNSAAALPPEAIRFPMATGPLEVLAYHTYAKRWSDARLEPELARLRLPSGVGNPERENDRLEDVSQARWLLEHRGGVSGDFGLSKEAERVGNWLGRFPLEWAMDIVDSYERGDLDGLLYAIRECLLEVLDGEVFEYESSSDDTRAAIDAVIMQHSPGATGPLDHAVSVRIIRSLWADDCASLQFKPEAKKVLVDAVSDIWEMLAETAKREKVQSPIAGIVAAYRQRCR